MDTNRSKIRTLLSTGMVLVVSLVLMIASRKIAIAEPQSISADAGEDIMD